MDFKTIRQRFKLLKSAVEANQISHNVCTYMRLYRSISWLEKGLAIIGQNNAAVELEGEKESVDHDLSTVCLWLALNALYGQWTLFDVDDEPETEEEANSSSGDAMPEHKAINEFLKTIFKQDKNAKLTAFVENNQIKIRELFSSKYMSVGFWKARYKNPSHDKPDHRAADDYDRLLREGNYLTILSKLIKRIYLLRCQLIHGASTYGSLVNRANVKICESLLAEFVPIVFCIMMDDHIDHDYGKLCYPPLA